MINFILDIVIGTLIGCILGQIILYIKDLILSILDKLVDIIPAEQSDEVVGHNRLFAYEMYKIFGEQLNDVIDKEK